MQARRMKKTLNLDFLYKSGAFDTDLLVYGLSNGFD
jgi:hypothetical protein